MAVGMALVAVFAALIAVFAGVFVAMQSSKKKND